MGDRAEVSHQLRTSDDHSLRLGSRADGARLSDTLRAPGLDRCAYSGGPAHEVRGRLLVLLAGPWLLGRAACRSLEVRRSGGWCAGTHSWSRPTARAGALRASGDNLVRAGTFDAVGDGNPVPERVGCPRLERTAPGRAECPPPASGMRVVRGRRGSARSAPVPPVPGGAALGSPAGGRGMRAAPIHVKSSRVTNRIYFWYI